MRALGWSPHTTTALLLRNLPPPPQKKKPKKQIQENLELTIFQASVFDSLHGWLDSNIKNRWNIPPIETLFIILSVRLISSLSLSLSLSFYLTLYLTLSELESILKFVSLLKIYFY